MVMNSYNIVNLSSVDSTNTFAMSNIDSLENFTVVSASVQTCGHGRFGREWLSSASGNIYASIVLKPKVDSLDISFIANYTQLLSVVVAQILETYDVAPEIKWPNDVLVNGKKIAGILCETAFRGTGLKGVVLGFGVNLNLSEADIALINQPAISLNILLKKQIDKDELLNKIIDSFVAKYDEFIADGFSSISLDYISRCNFLNKNVSIKTNTGVINGTAKCINLDGSMTLSLPSEDIVVYSGDLFWQ